MTKKIEKRTCPVCEEETEIVEKKISIPFGNESFTTKTLVCKRCGRYALTREIRKEMEAWGRKLSKNIVEPQPIFTEAAHQFAEELATQYGMKRVPFFRVLTTFYLNHVVNRDDFEELKTYWDTHVSHEFLSEGKRSKVSVPIRYLMYRRLQVFCQVWKTSHPKAIEEAVLFGLAVLSSQKENFERLKTIAESLKQYITDVAQAA